ncbi:MAG: hypothetical protein R3D43_06355 [Tepidamorphaceae bacterium]|nr:hypothetical protein [Rhodobiaceae bacterium]MCC0049447.1 hypothetical protein [Rhodobiaceae bacterium]
MGLLRLRLYRLNSPLRYLKTGRGLARLRETIDLKIVRDSEQQTDVFTYRQEADAPVRNIDNYLTGPSDNVIRILGLRPGRDNLDAFTVPSSYVDTKRGPKEYIRFIDPATGIPTGSELGPLLSRIDILHVEDWHTLVRTLQKELEAEIGGGTAEPRDHALQERLSNLELDDYTRSHFNRIFSFGDDWTGVSVNEIVNANAGEADTTFDGSRIDVKTILRKPGGGRFGKVTFDFTLNEDSASSFTQTIEHRTIGAYDVGEIDFRFTRPGLLGVTNENQEDLSRLFRSILIDQNLEEKIRRLESGFLADFNALWQETLADYPAALPYSHDTEVSVTRAGLADETLTRLMMVNGLPLWRNVSAKRPQLSGCIIRHRRGQIVQPLP